MRRAISMPSDMTARSAPVGSDSSAGSMRGGVRMSRDASVTAPRERGVSAITAIVKPCTRGGSNPSARHSTGANKSSRSGPVPCACNVRRKAIASATFDASMPLRRVMYRSKLAGLSADLRERPDRASKVRHAIGWSCRFAPTPGALCTRETPISARCVAGPIPEHIRMCGLPKAPAQSTTPRAVVNTLSPDGLLTRTPVARLPSNVSDKAIVALSTCRFRCTREGSSQA